MKKTVAFALVFVMLAMSIPAFAAEIGTQELGTEQTGAVMDVIYAVTPTYLVTIPNAIDFCESKSLYTSISAKRVLLPLGNKLNISVFSAVLIDLDNDAATPDVPKDAWTMVSKEGGAVGYTLNLDANKSSGVSINPLINGMNVLSVPFDQGDSVKVQKLFFDTDGSTQAGAYFDRLTFRVSVATM